MKESLGIAARHFRTPDNILDAIATAAIEAGLDEHEPWLLANLVRLTSEDGTEVVDARALLLACAIQLVFRRGSTVLPLNHLTEILQELCSQETSSTHALHDLIPQVVAAIATNALSPRLLGFAHSPTLAPMTPLILWKDALTTHQLFHFESNFSRAIAQRLATNQFATTTSTFSTSSTSSTTENSDETERTKDLNTEQQDAIRAATRHGLLLISGGPGTGKTTVVFSILQSLISQGLSLDEIALAAPTGKAAARLSESIQTRWGTHPPKAQTLHRLLGFSPSRNTFLFHANNPLPFRHVIVDESSMIDVFLMERLLAATPNSARLTLLGDADQLPSVAAGAVFSELIGVAPSVRLIMSYRMNPTDPAGSQILTIARRICAGEAQLCRPGQDFDEIPVVSFKQAQGVVRILVNVREPSFLELLRSWVGDLPIAECQTPLQLVNGSLDSDSENRLRQILMRHSTQKILCATRVGETGVDNVNAQARRFVTRRVTQAGSHRHDAVAAFLPGEPIMVKGNDYKNDIYNGDQGVVVRITEGDNDDSLAVAFLVGQQIRILPLPPIESNVEHAYAMTIHKSQGSEFDRVLLILPDEELAGCTRELLYTAATRARRLVGIIASPEILAATIQRKITRHSGLRHRLAGV